MKIRNLNGDTFEQYWDDGNRNEFKWHKKGFYKRYYKKKFIKQRLKENGIE